MLVRIACAAVAVASALPPATVFWTVPAGSAPDHPAVYASAWLTVLFWCVGVGLLLAGRGGRPSGPARAWWAAGCGFAALHVAAAMHAAHGWSHAAAYDHTAAAGGWGPGVFVNYAFVLVWAADAGWLLLAPEGYGRRTGWVTWAVVGFLGFVVFNAAVVFGHGPLRWVAAAAFAWLAREAWTGDRGATASGSNSRGPDRRRSPPD